MEKKDRWAIEEVLNSFSFNPKALAEEMARQTHRTLQQSLTRFCVEWLKVCASDDYLYDDRNEASHIVARKLMEGCGNDLPGLPFI